MERERIYEVVVIVGLLPDWYVEQYHDFCLEQMIEEFYRTARGGGDDSVLVNVQYAYSGPHQVRFYDEYGLLLLEREANLDEIFEAVLAEAGEYPGDDDE